MPVDVNGNGGAQSGGANGYVDNLVRKRVPAAVFRLANDVVGIENSRTHQASGRNRYAGICRCISDRGGRANVGVAGIKNVDRQLKYVPMGDRRTARTRGDRRRSVGIRRRFASTATGCRYHGYQTQKQKPGHWRKTHVASPLP